MTSAWRLSLCLMLLSFVVTSIAYSETPKTISDEFTDLEKDSKERLQWIRERNRELNADLGASANKAPIEKWIRKTYDTERTIKNFRLKDGSRLQLVDRGLGKATVLQRVRDDKTELVFSNLVLKKNNAFGFLGFSVSADQKTAALIFAENGSLDAFKLIALDLETRRPINKIDIQARGREAVWISTDRFAFRASKENDKERIGIFDRSQPGEVTYQESGGIEDGADGWGILDVDGKTILIDNSGQRIELKDFSPYILSVMGVVDGQIYFISNGDKEFGDIRRVPVSAVGTAVKPEIVVPESDTQLVSADTDEGSILANYRWGAEHTLKVFDMQGNVQNTLAMPDCCSYTVLGWKEPGKVVNFSFRSAVTSGSYAYDFSAGKWSPEDPKVKMLKTSAIEISTSIVMVTSADGTKVPMRITRRSDLAKDGQRPVMMEAYGGFSLPGYIDPNTDLYMVEFMKRGGVLAAAAVRGSNEIGQAWHKAATFEKKHNTMDDLVASARWMVKDGWTTADKIITRGTSNGGLTVASAALRAPDAFGLVIPVAGVNDMFKKEVLDEEFGKGWSYEYGDSREEKNQGYLKEIAPVELAAKQQKLPKILVVSGRFDSRVNPAHSYKLTAALLKYHSDQASSIRMLSINNSGHWLGSISYQDLIGWRTNVVEWVTIYDHLGWKF